MVLDSLAECRLWAAVAWLGALVTVAACCWAAGRIGRLLDDDRRARRQERAGYDCWKGEDDA